jgi:DNA-binding GntR family transcriptional regulator
VIDPDSGWPAWRQLADQLRGRILGGELQPGQALPSEERLRQETGLSRNTIRRAILTLRAEGLLLVDPPRGTFVRQPEEVTTVDVSAGTVSARMPTPDERREFSVPEGTPVLVVDHGGGQTSTYPADRVALRVTPGDPPENAS